MTRILIFSKDRPLQLDAALRSFQFQCGDQATHETFVLYRASSPQVKSLYQDLQCEYPTVEFVEEKNFKADHLQIVSPAKHILYVVDDCIFTRPFRLDQMVSALESQPRAIGVSLRLGINTRYCYSLDKPQTMPQATSLKDSLVKFIWIGADADYGYPLEVSSSLYRVTVIAPAIQNEAYKNPNELEVALVKAAGGLSGRYPELICPETSVAFCAPLNRVQDQFKNRCLQESQLDAQQLVSAFNSGKRIDILALHGRVTASCHEENDIVLMDRPAVTVIIPCYNQACFLSDAVDSVMEQTVTSFEIIIVNDGSTDDTASVASKLIEKYPKARIVLLNQANQGLSAARNAGARAAMGRYLLPLDADDCLDPEYLRQTLRTMGEHPEAAIVFTDIQHFGERSDTWSTGPFSRESMTQDNRIAYCSLYKREVFHAVGGYDETFKEGYEDWNFWLGAIENNVVVVGIKLPLFRYRKRPESMLAVANQKRQRLVARMISKHPALYSESDVAAAQQTLKGSQTPTSTTQPEAKPAPIQASTNEEAHWLNKAGECFSNKDIEGTIRALCRAIECDPKNTQTIQTIGGILYQAGRFNEAANWFRTISLMKPDNGVILVQYAMAAYKAKRAGEFEASLGRALEINPNDPAALSFLANSNLETKRYPDAARIFYKLLLQNPEDVEVMLCLGRCFFETGEMDSARTLFEQCLKVVPDHPIAKENLAVVMGRIAITMAAPLKEEKVNVPLNLLNIPEPKLPQSGSFSITYFVENMLGVTGGNQTLLRQANEMARRGHRVAIVTRTDRPTWFQFDPSISIIKAESSETLAAKTPICDVAVATYFTNVAELTNAPAATKVYYAQGDQYVFEEEGRMPGHGARLHGRFRELSRQSYILPGIRFVANSRNLAGAAQRVTGRLADGILPVCVDRTMFRPLAKAPSGQQRRILIVGPDFRGSAAEPLDFKGMAEIRQALELLQKKGHTFVTVRMSGSPPEIFKDFPCEFHMAPADPLKTMLYGTADILIYASHYDSCPRPPQEGMAAGVAVVCTATDGAMEYCRDNENCLLVPIQSPAAIADAVEKLLLDEGLRKRLAAGGLATAGEYPQEREWNEWEALIGDFVQEQKSGVVFKAKFESPCGPKIKSVPVQAAVSDEFPATGFVGRLKKAYELFGQSKFPEAWRSAQEALKVRPFHPEAYVMMGETALAAGDPPLASKCAQRALKMAPRYDLALDLQKQLLGRKKGARSMHWPALPPFQPDKPRLSVCLIAKNEENYLGKCLASIKPIAHQIIVVDTGSTDRTVEIAREYGAEVHHFAWNDNFSDARNVSLEHATGDWILVLDADEELPATEHAQLIKAMCNPSVIGYRLAIMHVGFEGQGADHVPRLFRNAPGMHFAGRVHEQVFHTVVLKGEAWGLKIDFCEALLVHHGYEANLMKSRQKVERNLQLLEKAVEEMPGEPHILLNLGLELSRSGRSEEGLTRYQQAFDIMSGMSPTAVVPELCEGLLTQYSSHLIKAKRFNDAVQVLRSPLAARLGLTATMYYILGVCMGNLKRHDEAVEALRECLKRRNERALTIILREIKSESPYICLANSLTMSGRTDEAESVYQKVLQEFPQSRSARREYAGFKFHKKQPVEALQMLHALTIEQADDAQVWELGGRVALSDPNFMELAMDWTDSALRNLPGHGPLVAQRAEYLMLAEDAAGALPLWTVDSLANNPRNLAGGLLCGIVTGDLKNTAGAIHPAGEAAVSREFLEHYRKLVRFGAERTIRTINEGIEEWKPLLPSAAQFLKQMMAEVNTAH